MTNLDTAKALWEEACRIHRRDLSAAVEDQDWNLCVRRSQEVVELALKAALRFLGYDYPKHHDVAPLFTEVVEKKSLPINREAVERLTRASYSLAQQRGLAFYAEKKFGREEGHGAAESAAFALQTLRCLFPSFWISFQ